MCGRYAVKKSTLLVANSLVKKNINVDLEKDNFNLADAYYEIHIYANYLLISLVTLHILAVIVHHFIFKDKILNKIT